MAFTKPNVNNVWANTGTVAEPAPAKVAQGWIAEIPDFQTENWVQQRQDEFNAHINQYGIPVWDALTEYQAGQSYVQGSNGSIYKAITTNTGQDPVSQPTHWQIAFQVTGTAYTKAEADDRFLNEDSNLSDLPNKGAARNNLDVYQKVDVYNKTEADDNFVDVSGDTMTGPLVLHGNPTTGLMAAPKQYVDAAANPVATVITYPVNVVPTGYLKCNGAAVSRTTYSNLFGVIGEAYGAGDGSTTFNLPDLRGEFIRGWDDNRGVDSGRAIGSFQADEIKSHTHTASTTTSGLHSHSGSTSLNGSHSHSIASRRDKATSGAYGTYGAGVDSGARTTSTVGNHNHSLSINSGGSHSHTVTIGSTGGSETRPRNIAMLYCIKY